MTPLPLVARFPALERIPRIQLGAFPTPVTRLSSIAPALWVKRDDLCADPIGGNKIRSLEFLLGGVRAGDRIVTVGSAGSTHALAVATYGTRLGARVLVGRWRQEMNEAATVVSDRIAQRAEAAPIFRTPIGAYAWAFGHRLRGARWIAAGGSTPLGILGHVNAGLELVDQIEHGELPAPDTIVAPLGTGGTIAGIALAFAIAGRAVSIVGARVVPRIVARASHVRHLANATAKLIESYVGSSVPRVAATTITVAHEQYGGAYGRETAAGQEATSRMREAGGVALDATYSAKAFAQAIAEAAHGPTLFWLTFDSRILDLP